MKGFLAKPKPNASEVSKAAGSGDLKGYATTGYDTALTPDNPGQGGLLRIAPPQKASLATARQRGAIAAAKEQILAGADNAVAAYKDLTDISNALTKVKDAHDKHIIVQSNNDARQLQSQHKVATNFHNLRPVYGQMTQQLLDARDYSDGYQTTLNVWEAKSAALMAG
ncbi:hypothetical protein NDA01_26530 [Trichocoleus desertorum AS-A10]|uniref:hypothetical protein n=1 Tax=Trichocoleus desertorum TaxID=1481672 RepID=UPI00329A6B01